MSRALLGLVIVAALSVRLAVALRPRGEAFDAIIGAGLALFVLGLAVSAALTLAA